MARTYVPTDHKVIIRRHRKEEQARAFGWKDGEYDIPPYEGTLLALGYGAGATLGAGFDEGVVVMFGAFVVIESGAGEEIVAVDAKDVVAAVVETTGTGLRKGLLRDPSPT